MTLRDELIQVAAVSVAIVQDMDKGTTELGHAHLFTIFTDITGERYRQEAKWGPQHHTPGEWLAILAEEVGEAARSTDPAEDYGVRNSLIASEVQARAFLAERFGS